MQKTKYLLTFTGGTFGSTPEEHEKMNAEWGVWYGSLGGDLVDPGSAVGSPVKVTHQGVEQGVTDTKVGGYAVVQTETLDQAIAHAQSNPIVAQGGSVEVLQFFS